MHDDLLREKNMSTNKEERRGRVTILIVVIYYSTHTHSYLLEGDPHG